MNVLLIQDLPFYLSFFRRSKEKKKKKKKDTGQHTENRMTMISEDYDSLFNCGSLANALSDRNYDGDQPWICWEF